MKANLHPEYQETVIMCACGRSLKTKATKQGMRVEICSACHPFYTGSKKLVDTTGRIEKFQKRYGKQK